MIGDPHEDFDLAQLVAALPEQYGNMSFKVSKGGYKIKQIFDQKSTFSKEIVIQVQDRAVKNCALFQKMQCFEKFMYIIKEMPMTKSSTKLIFSNENM